MFFFLLFLIPYIGVDGKNVILVPICVDLVEAINTKLYSPSCSC